VFAVVACVGQRCEVLLPKSFCIIEQFCFASFKVEMALVSLSGPHSGSEVEESISSACDVTMTPTIACSPGAEEAAAVPEGDLWPTQFAVASSGPESMLALARAEGSLSLRLKLSH